MAKLEGIDADALRGRLARADDPKVVKRLMVALAYKDGQSVAALSRLYGIPESTIYYWFERFESRSLDEALADDARPGRPRELSDGERRAIAADIDAPPSDHGYDAGEWSPALVRYHVATTYGVEYSLGHVRRLLREGALDYE